MYTKNRSSLKKGSAKIGGSSEVAHDGRLSDAKDDLGSKRREQMSVDCWRDQDLDDSRRPRLHRVCQRQSLSAVVSACRMVGLSRGQARPQQDVEL